MIPVSTMNGREVAVFGLGRSGIVTCHALAAGGANVHAWDDNQAARDGAEQAGLELQDLQAADWTRFATLVLAPGVPLTHPAPHWTVARAQDAGIEVIGDVELFARERAALCPEAPFVGITGTNGKSTTTALVTHLLKAAGRDAEMGGNIGIPVLDLAPPAAGRVHVIELSSYQIDLMATRTPTIAVLLNISPDHLDRHGTLANYAAIKERLLEDAAHTVVGIDDDLTRAVARRQSHRADNHHAISGGPISDGYGVRGRRVCAFGAAVGGARDIADISSVVSLRGRHNAQNAAAATAIAVILGLSDDEIAAGLASFPGLPHRMEEVARVGRTIFINDSKATNADSAANALASFDRDVFWIAGGLAKDGGIESLTDYFPRITKAYLIGAAAPDFQATLAGRVEAKHCATLDAAVASAAHDAAASSAREPVVLLAPACASFDQFRSFEVRGDCFRDLVAALPGAEVRERPAL